ncbi:hypothetical protein MHU86_1541 [Fragilaria crotonensis]|nr:hypothetical protein MHU86_1541 [Fragilaria crotonensis]
MSKTSHGKSHDPGKSHANPASHDDMSDVTVNNGKTSNENESQMISKVLKFSFVYSGTTQHKIAPSIIHTHWMQAVQAAFGTDVIIMNNQNQHVEDIDPLKWTDQTIHQKQFKLYQKSTGRDDRRNTTYYILHRIITNESISKIKATPSVSKIMKDYQCYVTDHQWDETQWDTTRLGFVTGHDPSFFNRSQAAAKFNTHLHSKPLANKIKIPIFRFVFTSPQIRHATHTVSTKAYAIEVLSEDSVKMLQVLKSLVGTTPEFAPYTLRRKYPEGYEKAIRYQTKLLTSTMVIILQNITDDMMFYLQDRILQTAGVKEILPSPKVHDLGRYSVLVDKELFKAARQTLSSSLGNWVKNEIPSDAQPWDDQFAGPARVKPLYDDGLSSGENSWMTQSNASFMSMDLPTGQDDDYFANSINATKVFTYADIDIPRTQSPQTGAPSDSQTKASISEISDTKTYADYVRKNDLETMTEAHQAAADHANQIIAAQRLEIEQLKAQRLDDIAQRVQETQTAKVKATFQEEATETLKLEAIQTKLEIHELRRDMQDMIQQFKLALATTVPNPDNKRNAAENADDNPPSEKRQDVRATPGKKLFTDEKDLQDSHKYLSALAATDTPSSPMK